MKVGLAGMLKGILTRPSGFGVRSENALLHFSHCRLLGLLRLRHRSLRGTVGINKRHEP
jgi:hypothetical protein